MTSCNTWIGFSFLPYSFWIEDPFVSLTSRYSNSWVLPWYLVSVGRFNYVMNFQHTTYKHQGENIHLIKCRENKSGPLKGHNTIKGKCDKSQGYLKTAPLHWLWILSVPLFCQVLHEAWKRLRSKFWLSIVNWILFGIHWKKGSEYTHRDLRSCLN